MGGGEPGTASEVTDMLIRVQQHCVTRLNRPVSRSLQEALALLKVLILRHVTYVEGLNRLGGF